MSFNFSRLFNELFFKQLNLKKRQLLELSNSDNVAIFESQFKITA
ncbi:hypothetical protein J696_03265 [Acinetobacter baumannii 1428368]|nr:hypothetical protein J696_03265 [Acinetobacter baumannii 1428368]